MKLSILEFFLISIPESFVYITGICFLSKNSFNREKLIIMSLLLAIESYSVRMLPIHFGSHIFINIIFSIIISVNIGKLSIQKAISYSMIMVIIVALSELITFFVMFYILKINIYSLKFTSLARIIYFIPSFILYLFSIFTINKLINRNK
ncbi:hypothetical protein [Clostridium sp. Marseille-Q2269]|uniref:hypothetical protein n=1 Tax=Clostridium sp. Marseille-Q2269 TaxID=2942205 RepID=UPI002072F694|nr:hypothetical protein [Clostridium sp. Marseille-Q2269]